VLQEGMLRVAGALASRGEARAFASIVQRVHHRYATEVVGTHGLCPFMRDPARSFGRFCVMLDREPDLEAALAEVVSAGSQVVHLVYPLVSIDVTPFERFGNELHQLVARTLPSPPVHATFHPNMEGDASRPSRLVGLLRRAPDPFVQFVPEGLHEGGTSFVDLGQLDLAALLATPARAQTTFERLTSAMIAAIVSSQDDIKADRDRSYAEHLDAFT
jgi:hypothetical protein